MSAVDRLSRHETTGLVLDADETREVLEHIAGLEKDAARYRWLRNESIDYPYGETDWDISAGRRKRASCTP